MGIGLHPGHGAVAQADSQKRLSNRSFQHNLSADLLIAVQGSTLELHDLETKFTFQYLTRNACSIDFVVLQEITVKFGPFW